MDARGTAFLGADESCWWLSLRVSELRETSRIPVAFAGVVLVSGAALCPFTTDCIQHTSSTVRVRSNRDEQHKITGATNKSQSRLIVLSPIFEQWVKAEDWSRITEQLILKIQQSPAVLEANTIVLQYIRTSPIFDGR